MQWEGNWEHMIKASTEYETSYFYLRYPTENNPNAKSRRRSGFFDNLVQFDAIEVYGVDNKEEAKEVTGENDEGGIFSFIKFEQNKISVMKYRGRNTLVANTYDVVAYLLEIVYDITISPVTNFSQNPGSESFIGIYSTA